MTLKCDWKPTENKKDSSPCYNRYDWEFPFVFAPSFHQFKFHMEQHSMQFNCLFSEESDIRTQFVNTQWTMNTIRVYWFEIAYVIGSDDTTIYETSRPFYTKFTYLHNTQTLTPIHNWNWKLLFGFIIYLLKRNCTTNLSKSDLQDLCRLFLCTFFE